MKGDNPYVMRALYIILVPLVLLMILLNSGWLQRLLPAATVHGERYSVVRYNFYYFDCYRAFLAENEGRLEELGFDSQRSEGEQQRSDGQTWKEYFQAQGEALMARTDYYCDLAQAAGYEFSEEELAPIAAQLERQREEYTSFGVSAGNYYISYYGAGMSEEAYAQELERKVKAQAYKAYLIGQAQPAGADVDRWLDEHPGQDYHTADLRVITLTALPERGTGEIGEAQLAALAEKLERLEARYQAGASFAELQAAFSDCTLGNQTGVVAEASAGDLPGPLAQWCLEDQSTLTVGDTCAVVDREAGTAYFAVLDSLGGSALEHIAREELKVQMIEAQEEAALVAYRVERSGLGMLVATT